VLCVQSFLSMRCEARDVNSKHSLVTGRGLGSMFPLSLSLIPGGSGGVEGVVW